MNKALAQLVELYAGSSFPADNPSNYLREIFQEIALCGLWRGKFFEKAAFYGGTSLRIFHGLDRYSEDLDFSLQASNAGFSLDRYNQAVVKEFKAWGLEVEVVSKNKNKKTGIESAFLKTNTLEQLVAIQAPDTLFQNIQPNQALKIKFEVDINPPLQFDTEIQYLLKPIPFPVKTFTLPCLFAGKMHALLYRNWKSRVKGRDWYDFIWFVSNEVPLNLKHLEQRLRQSGHFKSRQALSRKKLIQLYLQKVAELPVDKARADLERFVRNSDSLAVWSRDFFSGLIRKVKFQ
jgi:predicted nucleotidyltransferase component of viral defense system